MKSKNLGYQIDLDVLRAIAALSVFSWHYIHFQNTVPMETYIVGLSFFEEGHIGVSLFMVLSGYLFSRITIGHTINWPNFAWNRFLRIAPLLVVSQLAWYAASRFVNVEQTAWTLFAGFILPVWPGGAWSITVEIHYYLLLPLLLIIVRDDPKWIFVVLVTAIVARTTFDLSPTTGYNTILGRIDQFLIGTLIALHYQNISKKLAAFTFFVFLLYLEYFNFSGGHKAFEAGLGIIWPLNHLRWAIEGFGFAGLLVLVLRSDWGIKHMIVYRFLAEVGKISYSVYLLHFFVILTWYFAMSKLQLTVVTRIWLIVPCLFVTLCVSWISYRYFEMWFLKNRVSYIQ